MSNLTQRTFLHYDPERIDYSVSENELNQLCGSSTSTWKDFFIVGFGVGIPCIVNAVVEAHHQNEFDPTLSFVLNLLIGLVGIALGSAFGIVFFKSRSEQKEILEKIKNKPKLEITPKLMNVGPIDSGSPG